MSSEADDAAPASPDSHHCCNHNLRGTLNERNRKPASHDTSLAAIEAVHVLHSHSRDAAAYRTSTRRLQSVAYPVG